VVPHLLLDGSLQQLARYSRLFEMSSLLALSPGALEMDEFLALGLRPTRLVMLHVKDPRLLPSRTYFDNVLGWANVCTLHVSSQMASSPSMHVLTTARPVPCFHR
jgi:hypothetical protein